MKNADLSPLVENKKLVEIRLVNTKTSLKQWQALAPMKWLKKLQVSSNETDSADLKWVLDTFPKLEHLACAGDLYGRDTISYVGSEMEVDSLEIIDYPNLKTLEMDDSALQYMQTVHVSGSPNLTPPLRLSYVRKLRLTQANSITGLSVQHPFPRNADLEGLRDLAFFAVGGPDVTDDTIDALSNCKHLSQLTLAYPAVTIEGLSRLPISPRIGALSLPGTPLDDSVVDLWEPLSILTTLDVRDTEITGKSLRRLLSGGFATLVVLDRTKIDVADLEVLAQQSLLSELSLEGIGIMPNTLGAILANGHLKYLNLSKTTVTPELLNKIAAAPSSLEFLSLRGCELDEKAFVSLARAAPKLKFDIDTLAVSTATSAFLLTNHRVIEEREWRMTQWMNQQSNSTVVSTPFRMIQPELPSLIDVNFFAQLRHRPNEVNGSSPKVGGMTGAAGVGPAAVRFGRWLGGAIFGAPTAKSPQPSGDSSSDNIAAETDPRPDSNDSDSADNDRSESPTPTPKMEIEMEDAE